MRSGGSRGSPLFPCLIPSHTFRSPGVGEPSSRFRAAILGGVPEPVGGQLRTDVALISALWRIRRHFGAVRVAFSSVACPPPGVLWGIFGHLYGLFRS
jgi:hypothetical protein